MNLPKDDAAVLSARWTEGVLLKRDVFSTVERGRFRSESGEVDAVLRRLDQVPWWSFVAARHLFARERRALALARDLQVGPELLWAGRRALARGFIDGVALHLAKPHGDVGYFRSAKMALHRLHRAGICNAVEKQRLHAATVCRARNAWTDRIFIALLSGSIPRWHSPDSDTRILH